MYVGQQILSVGLTDILTKFELNWLIESLSITKFVILTLICKIHALSRWPKILFKIFNQYLNSS